MCGPLDDFYCRLVKQSLLERVAHLVSGCATFFTVGEHRVHGFEGYRGLPKRIPVPHVSRASTCRPIGPNRTCVLTPSIARRGVQRRQRLGTRPFLEAERGSRRGTQLSVKQLA